MNIRITHQWLQDYLATDASPYEIQKYLSLSGPSIEKVEQSKNDFIYDIEIISNRIDTASVIGIAQEAIAILPRFGKKAKLTVNPFEKYQISNLKHSHKENLKVLIDQPNLCSRFTAIILDKVKISSSPEFIKHRLQSAGIKVINNVVDISNYLMITLGQPVHIFDFDQIKGQLMIVREAQKGEKIITLDKNEVTLTGGDIVIEDKEGRLIDLCGIMGGLNSSVTNKTKRILLFVQTYNKEKIRRTVMTTGVRTIAATYFEKGLDEERVEPTLVYGIELLKEYAQAEPVSQVYDIYPNPYIPKKISTTFDFINQKIGLAIDKKIVLSILSDLNFKPRIKGEELTIEVPFYRKYDISLPEDVVEEVARIYGYDNLPNRLSPPAIVFQPEEYDQLFNLSIKIKYFLKHLGLNEAINYSMISKEMIEEWGLDLKNHLKIKNTISKEIEYLRTTLLPSLYKNIRDNQGKKEVLKFFEIAKVYHPKNDDLPDENYRLGIAVNTDYYDLKGIVEALIGELNIETLNFEIIEKNGIYLVEIDLKNLVKNYHLLPKYHSINPYAVIKLDKTFILSKELTFEKILNQAKLSPLFQKLEVIDLYKNRLTLRFYFSSKQRNINEEEAKKELEKI